MREDSSHIPFWGISSLNLLVVEIIVIAIHDEKGRITERGFIIEELSNHGFYHDILYPRLLSFIETGQWERISFIQSHDV